MLGNATLTTVPDESHTGTEDGCCQHPSPAQRCAGDANGGGRMFDGSQGYFNAGSWFETLGQHAVFSAHEKIDVISSCWALTFVNPASMVDQRQYDNTPLRELMKLISI